MSTEDRPTRDSLSVIVRARDMRNSRIAGSLRRWLGICAKAAGRIVLAAYRPSPAYPRSVTWARRWEP